MTWNSGELRYATVINVPPLQGSRTIGIPHPGLRPGLYKLTPRWGSDCVPSLLIDESQRDGRLSSLGQAESVLADDASPQVETDKTGAPTGRQFIKPAAIQGSRTIGIPHPGLRPGLYKLTPRWGWGVVSAKSTPDASPSASAWWQTPAVSANPASRGQWDSRCSRSSSTRDR